MKTSINREYAARHLFACLVMAGLCAWFAYDGLVRYPATPAPQLYESIEKSKPQAGMESARLEAFKAQKIKSQLLLSAFCLVVFAVVGLRLARSFRFRLEYDDEGFETGGARFSYGDVKSMDVSSWAGKGVARFVAEKDGVSVRITVDSWHHSSVREFVEKAMSAKSPFPRWRELSPEKATAELPRLMKKAEAEIAAIEKSEPKTFEDFVWRLDDAMRESMRLWGMVQHMHSVMNDDKWRAAVDALQPAVVSFSLRIGQSRELYAHAKRLLAGMGEGGARKRILEDMVKAAERSGVALEGEAKKRFCEISAELAKIGSDFHNAVLDATKAFKFEKDGKTYTIDDAEYPETMKHCADREVRKALYFGRSRRAPENAARISRILELRREMASLLGFGNYAELSIDSKCAPSCAAVMKMIDDLDAATAAPAEAERAELGGDDTMPWDVSYLAERLREKKYSYSEEELKRHFEFAAVLNGMFKMATFLFGVEFREITGSGMPQTWHDDVRFFEVLRGGIAIAHFYLDPYVRTGLKSGGAWMNSFSDRSRRRGELPLALMALNLPLPDGDGKCFMPFREVETIFHEFGHALQCMITLIDEEDAAGLNLVEWDAVEVASQFMENWCLDDRTGIPVPEDLKRRVRAAKNFRAATACRRQLAFAKTDILLHLGAVDDPDAVKNEMFDHFGVPRIEGDLFLNSFSHIFGGGYAAGYYSYKWSEVMSADLYGAFEEAGLGDDAKVRELGSRLASTVYGLGGSVSAYEAFRLFRGREPSIEALLRQRGLARG